MEVKLTKFETAMAMLQTHGVITEDQVTDVMKVLCIALECAEERGHEGKVKSLAPLVKGGLFDTFFKLKTFGKREDFIAEMLRKCGPDYSGVELPNIFPERQ